VGGGIASIERPAEDATDPELASWVEQLQQEVCGILWEFCNIMVLLFAWDVCNWWVEGGRLGNKGGETECPMSSSGHGSSFLKWPLSVCVSNHTCDGKNTVLLSA
jgi:hypothetical protein